MNVDERRLGDRILHALDLALEQEELEIAEHLARALEEAMTRFGGSGATERRDVPEAILTALDRLEVLRERTFAG